MKRIVPLLLVLMLLCGCSVTEVPSTSESSIPTEAPTNEPIPTEMPTEAPFESELLEGGIRVHTDYSQYTLDTPMQPKYTRLSQEHISELQPRDDYGMLYPFVGNRICSDYSYKTYYGMVDASGCIVVDAVYDSINLVSRDYWDLYQHGDLDFPMWALGKTGLTEYGYATTTYALASLDGSFVSEHIYSQLTAYDEYVFAYIYHNDDAVQLHVYDMEGNLCLDSKDLPFCDRLDSYYDAITYGDGLFTVILEGPSGEREYYIADWEGNLLYGPFQQAECYHDGYALVGKTDDLYAFIDVNGNYFLDMEFSSAWAFRNGYADAKDAASGQCMLLSAEEKIVFSVDADGCYWDGKFFSVTINEDGFWRERFYNKKGEFLYEGTQEEYCSLFGSEEQAYVNVDNKIINLQTGEEYTLEGMSAYYVYSYDTYYPFEEVSYFQVNCYDEEESEYTLFDRSFRKVISTNGYIDITQDAFTKERYITIVNGNVEIYSIDAQPIATFQFPNYRFVNNRVLCYNDMYSCYYDLEGNLLFCYPYSGMGDD